MKIKLVIVAAMFFAASQSYSTNRAEDDMVFQTVNGRLQTASTNNSPIAEMALIARDAELEYAQFSPASVARIFSSAANLVNFFAQTNRAAVIAYHEFATRQRRYSNFLPPNERLWRLKDAYLPLDSKIETISGINGSSNVLTELEFSLGIWRDVVVENQGEPGIDNGIELRRPKPPVSTGHLSTNAAGITFVHAATDSITPEQVQNPLERERYRDALEAYRNIAEQRLYRSRLQLDGSSFTNKVIQQIVREYSKQPHLLGHLQEVMDGYLPPADSTNVMNKVFAAMKPEVAAKTPRPVPGAKGERWLRPAAAPAGPVTPAVARPNRVVDAMRKQQAAQAAQAAGAASAAQAGSAAGVVAAAGGKPVWAWVGLGLVALAGGWVWVRTRG